MPLIPKTIPISNKEVANTHRSSILSTSSQMGLLSLPPELRVMIYHQVLVRDHPIEAYFQDFPPLLDTCQLLREEALHVMMTKNTFFIGNHNPSPRKSNTTYTESALNLRLWIMNAAAVAHVDSGATPATFTNIIWRLGFGLAVTFANGFGLQFHPQRFRESLPKVD
ncbi:hypothetical protein MMC07_001714 [Pseudocyphellaria aurata]|nr:hypothetical protein [Pseudocyphellaria aurata]